MSGARGEGGAARDGGPAPLYECGEGVLGWHVSGEGAPPVLYKARVLRCERRGNAWWYSLKYQGFPSRWNTWNREALVARDTTGNRKTMEGILGSLKVEGDDARRRKDGGPGASASAGGSPSKAGKAGGGVGAGAGGADARGVVHVGAEGAAKKLPAKRKFETTTLGVDETHELGCLELWEHIRAALPRRLLAQLHEDWQQVCREGRLVELPRDPSAADILWEYVEAKRSGRKQGEGERRGGGGKGPSAKGGGTRRQHGASPASSGRAVGRTVDVSVAEDVARGLGDYLSVTARHLLLYTFEGDHFKAYQDHEAGGGAVRWDEVVGAEHLLRLFVRLPCLVRLADFPESSRDAVIDVLADILDFMDANYSRFFLFEYGLEVSDFSSTSSSDDDDSSEGE